jgi:hypothetical protein
MAEPLKRLDKDPIDDPVGEIKIGVQQVESMTFLLRGEIAQPALGIKAVTDGGQEVHGREVSAAF